MKTKKTDPQWQRDVHGVMDPTSKPLRIVALDPAKSSGLAVVSAAGIHHAQCALNDVGAWLLPLTEGHPCLVAVERGYIVHPPANASEAVKRQSERAQMVFMERCGRLLQLVDECLILAAPVWRPNAKQWRKLNRPWPEPSRSLSWKQRRQQHKQTAVDKAEAATGDPFTKQPHWYENNTKRFRVGTLLDDEADAVCQAIAAQRLAESGGWATWSEVD